MISDMQTNQFTSTADNMLLIREANGVAINANTAEGYTLDVNGTINAHGAITVNGAAIGGSYIPQTNGTGHGTTLAAASSVTTTNFVADVNNQFTNTLGGNLVNMGNTIIAGQSSFADSTAAAANFAFGINAQIWGGGNFGVGYSGTIFPGCNDSFVGGQNNTVTNGTGNWAGAGYGNVVGGNYSFVAGYQNTAWANYATALGENASATNSNSFVWSDGTAFGSTSNQQFSVNASGGIVFNGISLTFNGNPVITGAASSGAGVFPGYFVTNAYPATLNGIYTNSTIYNGVLQNGTTGTGFLFLPAFWGVPTNSSYGYGYAISTNMPGSSWTSATLYGSPTLIGTYGSVSYTNAVFVYPYTPTIPNSGASFSQPIWTNSAFTHGFTLFVTNGLIVNKTAF